MQHIKQQTDEPSKSLVIACGALGREIFSVLKQTGQGADTVKVQCLPAHFHNTPEKIAPGVEAILKEHRSEYQSVLVAYGECGTGGALDKVLQTYNAERIPGAHCYEFYAGTKAFEHIIEKDLGSFFLTDYLAKNFHRLVFQHLGLDRYPHLRDLYFGNYTQMVYLAQIHDENIVKQAQLAADSVGLTLVCQTVGYGGLHPALERVSSLNAISVSVQSAKPSN